MRNLIFGASIIVFYNLYMFVTYLIAKKDGDHAKQLTIVDSWLFAGGWLAFGVLYAIYLYGLG